MDLSGHLSEVTVSGIPDAYLRFIDNFNTSYYNYILIMTSFGFNNHIIAEGFLTYFVLNIFFKSIISLIWFGYGTIYRLLLLYRIFEVFPEKSGIT